MDFIYVFIYVYVYTCLCMYFYVFLKRRLFITKYVSRSESALKHQSLFPTLFQTRIWYFYTYCWLSVVHCLTSFHSSSYPLTILLQEHRAYKYTLSYLVTTLALRIWTQVLFAQQIFYCLCKSLKWNFYVIKHASVPFLCPLATKYLFNQDLFIRLFVLYWALFTTNWKINRLHLGRPCL